MPQNSPAIHGVGRRRQYGEGKTAFKKSSMAVTPYRVITMFQITNITQ